MRKYELLNDDVMSIDGRKLYRIRALKDFGNVRRGNLGGYIESEENLSHMGKAWVGDNARVYQYGKVIDNAIVSDYAMIDGHAVLAQNANVRGFAHVGGNVAIGCTVHVAGNAHISGHATVIDNACVEGNAEIFDSATICQNAFVRDNVVVSGNAKLCGHVRAAGHSCITGYACLAGYVRTAGHSTISGGTISGNIILSGNAMIKSDRDYSAVVGFGSKYRDTTFFRLADGDIGVQCGCFYGTLDEFRKKVVETHGDTKYAEEYLMIADLMKKHFIRESESLKCSSPFI